MALLKRGGDVVGHVSGDGLELDLVLAGHRALPRNRGPLALQRSIWIFVHVIAGAGQVSCASRRRSIGPGDWFFAFPDQLVCYQESPADPWTYYWVGFQGERMEQALAAIGIGPDTLSHQAAPDCACRRRFAALLQTLDTPAPAALLQANALLWELLAGLGDSLQRARPDSPRRTGRQLDAIQRAELFISNHFASGIGAADVARHVGHERSYFSKHFRQATGRTLLQAIGQRRLVRAQQLLVTTDLPLSAVAGAVGMARERSFTRWFQKATGLPPGAWRQRRARSSP